MRLTSLSQSRLSRGGSLLSEGGRRCEGRRFGGETQQHQSKLLRFAPSPPLRRRAWVGDPSSPSPTAIRETAEALATFAHPSISNNRCSLVLADTGPLILRIEWRAIHSHQGHSRFGLLWWDPLQALLFRISGRPCRCSLDLLSRLSKHHSSSCRRLPSSSHRLDPPCQILGCLLVSRSCHSSPSQASNYPQGQFNQVKASPCRSLSQCHMPSPADLSLLGQCNHNKAFSQCLTMCLPWVGQECPTMSARHTLSQHLMDNHRVA